MKRILMVSSEIHPYHSTGGLGIAVSRLLRQLANYNVNVTFLCPHGINPPSSVFSAFVKFHELEIPICGTEQDSDERTDWLNCFAKTVLAYVKSFTGDLQLIILHDNETAACVGKLKESNITYPILYWMHSLYDYPYKHGTSLIGDAVRMSDWVAVSSGVLEDAVQLQWPQRLAKVRHELLDKKLEGRLIIATAQGCIDHPKTKYRCTDVMQDDDVPSVLFSGRTSFSKGVGFLEKLASSLASEGICLRVTGQKPKGFDVKDNIDWIDWLDTKALLREYKRAICIVSPSLTEGFGLSVIDALSQNCVVIAFPVGGLRDLEVFKKLILVKLTISERELLYHIWSEILDSFPYAAHLVWRRNQHKLQTIQNKFTAQTISTVLKCRENKLSSSHNPPNIANWGTVVCSLLNRIENPWNQY